MYSYTEKEVTSDVLSFLATLLLTEWKRPQARSTTATGAKSNFTTGFKDSFTKSSILTALGMAFLKDMLAAVENPLLKNAIKEYMDCLEEENKARAKILEYEEDI